MPLSDVTCRTAKADARPQKLSDGGGLQLWVQPNGAKLWRFAYRFGRKQKLLALGAYPLVTLANARIARDAAKRQLIDLVDPSAARKEQRAEQRANHQTFRLIASEFIEKLREEKRTEKTLAKNVWLLDFAYQTIGDRPITTIKPSDVLQILRKLERRGRYHSAHRLRSTISSVFRLAIATDRAEGPSGLVSRGPLIHANASRRGRKLVVAIGLRSARMASLENIFATSPSSDFGLPAKPTLAVELPATLKAWFTKWAQALNASRGRRVRDLLASRRLTRRAVRGTLCNGKGSLEWCTSHGLSAHSVLAQCF
jgi:hypothetical protein